MQLIIDVEKVEALIEDKGWSVITFAKRCGMSRGTWYKIVNDHGRTSLANAGLVARGLNVHPFEILKAEGYRPPPLVSPLVAYREYG